MEFRSKDGGTSLLDALLYSMSTGHVDFNWEKLLEKDSQDYQKKFLSVMVASDVLLQNVRVKPGYFQLVMNVLLNKQKVTQNFMAALSAFNLAPSRSYRLRDRLEVVINQHKKGLNIKPRDLVIIYFDNVEDKVLGRQASYDQWIVVSIVVITENQLKGVGFYQDSSDLAQRLSRELSVAWT